MLLAVAEPASTPKSAPSPASLLLVETLTIVPATCPAAQPAASATHAPVDAIAFTALFKDGCVITCTMVFTNGTLHKKQ